MRERGCLSLLALVVMVVVVVAGALQDATATPAPTTPHHHHQQQQQEEEEASGRDGTHANHVNDAYLDDALDEWLNNFDTYTFMVKQDLDSHESEGEEEEGLEAATTEEDVVEEQMEEEEEEEEEEDEEWSAPIAVSAGSNTLLDPYLDHLVTVESLVAEEGSIFLLLSKYKNQTECGVGELTVEAAMRPTPRLAGVAGVAGGERSNTSEEQSGSASTFLSFGPQDKGNMSLPDTSAWAEVSEDYWWARGRLAGGGMLSITFTPPECGCLALSTYYALPVGDLTLVVGPQAYPDELQVLLCVDPLAVDPDHIDYDDDEEADDGEEEEVGEFLQKPSPLVAPRNTGETETEIQQDTEEPTVTPRRRKANRGEKRKAKKARRQMKRQKSRQAGRRQARRQQRQQQRQEEEEEVEDGGETATVTVERMGRRWKHRRKGKKAWRKIKKHGRRGGRRRFHAGKHHHHDQHHPEEVAEGVNGTSLENMTHNHHHHHHHPHHNPHHHHPDHHHPDHNVTAALQQEERLIDILLRDLPANSTLEGEEHEEEVAGEAGSAAADERVSGEEEEGEEEEEEAAQTPRQRRKNRRQRKKMMRKERKKAHPPGVKFCCKQGVKHKRNILELNSTSVNSVEPCNKTSEVVSTFANHQFGIDIDTCDKTYTKCCTKFTAEMWDAMKAKKMARRMERKQRRKARRQSRKYRRKNERRMQKVRRHPY